MFPPSPLCGRGVSSRRRVVGLRHGAAGGSDGGEAARLAPFQRALHTTLAAQRASGEQPREEEECGWRVWLLCHSAAGRVGAALLSCRLLPAVNLETALLNPSWAGGHYCGPSIFNCHALLTNAWKQHVSCMVQ